MRMALMAALAAMMLPGCGKTQETQETAADEPVTTEEESAEEENVYGTDFSGAGTISWNGKSYRYNDHLSNFLFLGIDNREPVETEMGSREAGQSDAIYLLSWDRMTGDMTLISIPRDTITTIEVFGKDGSSLGTTKNHLNLAYAYGDGKHESAKLSVEAVSNLLFGISIQGYCAANMDAFPVLTESIGGLDVVVPNSSLEEKDPDYYEGATVTLNADNTEFFVRYRDITISQSALTRMERQQAFMEAYGEKVKELAAKDAGIITEIYSSLQPYLVTNIGMDQFMKLAESYVGGAEISRWTVPGEAVEGNQYDEFYVDDEALYEKMIETFYEEVE